MRGAQLTPSLITWRCAAVRLEESWCESSASLLRCAQKTAKEKSQTAAAISQEARPPRTRLYTGNTRLSHLLLELWCVRRGQVFFYRLWDLRRAHPGPGPHSERRAANTFFDRRKACCRAVGDVLL